VWVLDENSPRRAKLIGPETHRIRCCMPSMRLTLKLLWRSADGELETSGKYKRARPLPAARFSWARIVSWPSASRH